MNQQNLASDIWNIADTLRGDFKQSEFGRVILPFAVLRRLECVLEPTRSAVLAQYEAVKTTGIDLDLVLPATAQANFYNVSQFNLATLGSTSTRANLEDYVAKFSANARQVFEHFEFGKWLEKLEKANLLYMVANQFANLGLHPNVLTNHEMGLVFEHLIRKFAESANDTAGEFFTPRDVVRLVTTLVFATDHEALNGQGVIRTVYDCAAGTGGFLSSAIEQVQEWNPNAKLVPYAQELNPETYAISVADKLIQGYDVRNLKLGNTLNNDQLRNERFDYCLANPPFGVKWEKVQADVNAEHVNEGFAGRFGPGLPRVGDGSLLFLMHLLSKRKPVDEHSKGTRIGIVLSGSPLFNGGAGSGESEIRRWILENDWLEAIVALPNDLFYNTGIGTYIWVLSNHKAAERKGLVQLIDASALHTPMQKSLGSKRKRLSEDQIAEIARLLQDMPNEGISKLFKTTDFGYRRITVERPLRMRFDATEARIANFNAVTSQAHADKLAGVSGTFDSLDALLKAAGIKKLTKAHLKELMATVGIKDPDAQPMKDMSDKGGGNVMPDADLREFENVPLGQPIADYFAKEVLPHVPDAWIDGGKKDEKDGQVGIVGYEINFNRYFYQYQPPRPLAAIDADLKAIEAEIAALLGEVTE
ncbi:class I SAM-dependent DNA methyltransferase [Aquabacterium sp. A08]|uniref:type I restriction-modification system subunit M n=1 Tax=Aquabacterium sp. A08 TaxID=2718532 RepID=UPI00142362B8|nr:class I SAM-dependent DNA methyltransferase [Aquabacterium sp. A08]NIC42307.1 SAM-dependent DNA methyltransferase [Aquabacterium sp. A08]